MSDTIQHISLLYELSVTTLKYFNPSETAKNFITKLLSRKNLQYGAIWRIDKMDEEYIHFELEYAMPSVAKSVKCKLQTYSNAFVGSQFLQTDQALFEEPHPAGDGYYLYFKLQDIGILELFSRHDQEKVSIQSFYNFRDVFYQLSVSLESAHSYQNLQREIQQRKFAERSLRSNEKKYRRIVDNIQLGLLEVDNDDIIQYANKPFCRLVGYSLDEILGKNASNLFLLEEEDQATMRQHNQSRRSGDSSAYEMPFKTKQGEIKWGIISGAPNYDAHGNQIGSIGIHLDVTRQKELVNEYAFQESKLKNLFEVSLDALISIDHTGKITEWNPQAEKIFGYSRNEIMGKSLSNTIIPTAFRKAHNEGMEKFRLHGHGPVLNQRIEITALRKGGEEFPIELTIFPIKYNDEYSFTAFARDITELKESRVMMKKALKEQTDLNDMKSQFVSMTSHELRTPLTSMNNDMELINHFLENSEVLPKERFVKIAKRMDANIERLKDLVSNILLVGQLDSRKVPFSPEATDIVRLVNEKIVENYIERDRKLLFELTGTPFEMKVDKKLFTQILDNLVNNAYKYSQTQSPELKLHFHPDHLLIEVADYGIGIPEKEQPKLFNSFFRASNVGGVQGSGLGLSIVNEFIKLHDGTISFKSKVNEGTTFLIQFPKNLN